MIFKGEKAATLKKSILYLKEYKYKIAILTVVTISANLIELMPPYLSGKIIDYVTNNKIQEVKKTIILLIIIFFLSMFLSFIETYLSASINNNIICDIKKDIFYKITSFNFSEFYNYRNGDLISRLENDAGVISNFYTNELVKIFIEVVTAVISCVYIFKISVSMSLIGIISMPIYYVIYFFLGKKMKNIEVKIKRLNDNYFSFVNDALKGIKDIKSLNSEGYVNSKYCTFMNKFYHISMRHKIIDIFAALTSVTSNTVTNIVIMAVGCIKILNKTLTIGLYVSFNAYMQKFIDSVGNIMNVNVSIQEVLVASQRIQELLNKKSEDLKCIKGNYDIKGNIYIKDLCFKYNENENLINNLDLRFQENSIYGIVGPSGCGKSTLLNIIMRFYDYDKGNIYFDDKDIKKQDLEFIRRNITYVQQEPLLFNGTIKENLLMGNLEASDNDIIDACKKSYIHCFINKLPLKYDTVIGKDGMNFSRGQKQRIALARGILKNSKIILLDEITSGLDGESEGYIVKTIDKLSCDHTVIVVSHQLSTIIDIPQIFVMDQGNIVGIGNHQQLIGSCKVYRKLFLNQWLEFNKEDIKQIKVLND